MTSKAILPLQDHTHLIIVQGFVTQFTISRCEVVVKKEWKWSKWTEGGRGMRIKSWATDAFFHKIIPVLYVRLWYMVWKGKKLPIFPSFFSVEGVLTTNPIASVCHTVIPWFNPEWQILSDWDQDTKQAVKRFTVCKDLQCEMSGMWKQNLISMI